MKLSIVVPLYNSEKYISECLNSLLDQSVSQDEYEIVIINDGSVDNGLQIVNNYIKEHSNITVYSQKNKGVAAARNMGVKIAKGEYIFFVDSDDYIASNVLETMLSILDNKIELLAFKSVQTTQTNLKISQNLKTIKISNEIIDGTFFIEKYGFKDAIGWYMVSKKFLKESNLVFLEGKMLEDISFNLIMLTTVERLCYLPLDVYRYVARQNSIMTKTNAAHFKKIISDYERIICELEVQIEKFKANRMNAANRLRGKQEGYHFFLFMRFVRSNLTIKEIDKKLNHYKNIKLYPLTFSSKNLKKRTIMIKILIFIFNRKYLFYPFLTIYRLVSKRAI